MPAAESELALVDALLVQGLNVPPYLQLYRGRILSIRADDIRGGDRRMSSAFSKKVERDGAGSWYLQNSAPSVHTLALRENRERPESGIYFQNSIFNEYPVRHDDPMHYMLRIIGP